MFLREKKDGSQRPIINLKKLNYFVEYQKFKMESLKDVKNILNKGDYMIKIDLKDAYYSIPLHESSRKYVRFQWEGNLYECCYLMFGLGPALRIFSKLLKIPIALLRKLKIRIIIFIDDMLIIGASIEETIMARDSVIILLEALGFTIKRGQVSIGPNNIIGLPRSNVGQPNSKLQHPTGKKMEKLISLCQKHLTNYGRPPQLFH